MTRPKAVVAMQPRFRDDHLDQTRLDRLATLVEVTGVVDSIDDPAAAALLADVEVLVATWGLPPLDAERLAAMPKLRLVTYCAGTVRGFATPELWERGVAVTSAALANGVPVVEYTVAMIALSLKKALFLPPRQGLFGDGRAWGDLSGYERTVGIVGLSSIGRGVVAALPKLLPSTRILAYDPFATEESVAGLNVELASLDEVCRQSAVLSIHAPDLPSTYHMIGAGQLALLPDHATLINTARGRVLDHDALLAECRSGRLDAVLDVTDPEPLPDGHPLLGLDNVIVTPHIAGSRGTELRRMTDMAFDDLQAWLEDRPGDMRGKVDPATLGTSA